MENNKNKYEYIIRYSPCASGFAGLEIIEPDLPQLNGAEFWWQKNQCHVEKAQNNVYQKIKQLRLNKNGNHNFFKWGDEIKIPIQTS